MGMLFFDVMRINLTRRAAMVLALLLPLAVQAQEAPKAACLWPIVGIRATPEQSGAYLEATHFGDVVETSGESVLNSEENRTYIQVKSRKTGKVGWVNRYLFEPNAYAVVTRMEVALFDQPNSASLVSNSRLNANELAVVTDFDNEWAHLVSIKRGKKGWVRYLPYDPISAEAADITQALAAYNAAEQASSNSVAATPPQSQAYGYDGSGGFSPPAYGTSATSQGGVAANPSLPPVGYDLPDFNTFGPQASTSGSAATAANTRYMAPAASATFPTPPATQPLSSSLTQTMVYDELSGRNFLQTTETGGVFEIQGIANANLYQAYHKTLPVGAQVLLSIPDNPGFVKLDIVGTLAAERPEIIGLSPACKAAVLGAGQGVAQVIYFMAQ